MLSNSTMRVRSRSSLQLAGLPRLGGQVVFGRLHRALQVALHRGHVVDRLGHHAREFLHAREAVELQRIEACAASLACAMRDCIWFSACISMSRSCARRRSRLPVRSPSEPRSWPSRLPGANA